MGERQGEGCSHWDSRLLVVGESHSQIPWNGMVLATI